MRLKLCFLVVAAKMCKSCRSLLISHWGSCHTVTDPILPAGTPIVLGLCQFCLGGGAGRGYPNFSRSTTILLEGGVPQLYGGLIPNSTKEYPNSCGEGVRQFFEGYHNPIRGYSNSAGVTPVLLGTSRG